MNITKSHWIRLKDGGTVQVRITLECQEPYVIQDLGLSRGDPSWNDGQGYVVLKLSALRERESFAGLSDPLSLDDLEKLDNPA